MSPHQCSKFSISKSFQILVHSFGFEMPHLCFLNNEVRLAGSHCNLCLFPSLCSTSIKYSHAGETDGARLLVICDVALGKCMDLLKKDFSLTEAPPGYDSVHGVSKTASVPTDFEVFYFRRHADPGSWVSSQTLA